MKKLIAFTILGLIAFVCALVGATVIGYSDWSLISTPASPASGFLRLYSDSGTSTVKCKTSAGAACFFATSVAGVTIETNGVNNSSQTALNLKSGGSVVVSNPSGGDVNITGPAFQTNGTPNATQTTLNLKAGANITLTNSGADVTIAASGGGAALTLQVNGTPNGSQTLLNLVAGSNITLTDNGTGSITIAASGGGGGTVTSVTASAPLTSSGGGTPNISASWQGNGSLIQRSTGSTTTGNCAQYDANGNTTDSGGPCGGSGVTNHVCVIDNDTQSSSALGAVQISGGCEIPAASTIYELDVWGGTGTTGGALTTTGTSSINLEKWAPSSGATTTLLSGALATASGKACAKTTTSATCANGLTSSGSITISTTALSVGDWVRVSAATADGAQTWYRIALLYTY